MSLRLDASDPSGPLLVFLPGFMTAATSYADLLRPLTAQGISVLVPQLYRRGVGTLAGRVPVEREALDAVSLVLSLASGRSRPVALGGHSRGGQAAWRAADVLAAQGSRDLPAALVLVDPVDGAGRRPSAPSAAARPPRFTCPCLIVGAGIAGRCAPAPVNHEVFAGALPTARHVVVPGLGHGDVLDDRPAARARRLCGGAVDPRGPRAQVTALIADALEHLSPPG